MTIKPPSSAIVLFVCCLTTAAVKVADSSSSNLPSRKTQHPPHTPPHNSSPSPQRLSSENGHESHDLNTHNVTLTTLLKNSSNLNDITTQNVNTSSAPTTLMPSEVPAESTSRSSVESPEEYPAAGFPTKGSHESPDARSLQVAYKRLNLYIVGLFAIIGSYPVGSAFQYAAELAVEDINKREDVLPGYKIVLDIVNTECDIATGMDGLYQRLYNSSTTKIMVLGGTCSDTTEKTAQASKKYNLLQVSYSTLSPRLSSRKEFPWFFRVMASERELSKARLALLAKFNWTTITIIQASAHLFSATAEEMRNLVQKNNMTVNGTYPFDSNLEKTIEQLKRNDARIIYFNSYEDQARNACCVAFKKGFYGKSIVWIFPGFYDLKWYDHDDFNCSARDKLKVINGYFTVSNVNMAAPDEGQPIGATQKEYLDRFKCKALHSETCSGQNLSDVVEPGQIRAPLSYDAMWAIALALNATLTEMVDQGRPPSALNEFSYHNYEMGQMIFRHMQNTSFRGISGKINFTPTGDRIPQIEIKQFQVTDLDAVKPITKLQQIGLYTNPSDIKWNTSLVQWAGSYGGNPPYSSRRTERVLKPLSRQLYVAMCLLASVGVLVSVAFLAFNIRNRNVRLIKMSSPKINNLILVGCMLVYCTVSVSDILTQGLDVLCHVRLYLLVMGFSLGFGALFAKTWRVYEIMTAAAGSRRLNTRALLDSRLYLIVLGLVAVNLCLLVVWTIMDAMVMTAIDIEDAEVHRDDDVLEIPQSLECHSRYKLQFTIGLMALQALLILFGAFLAVQTRKVTIPELNDSRWVGLCIYNVVVLGSLGAILILGTRQPPDVTYLLESLIVLVGTTLTQCLVFVPKLLAFRRSKRGRQGSQYMVTVKTLSISVPSNSPISKDPKSPADPKLSSSCSRSSPGSSPSKTLRKASRSLSTVLKKCCSPDKEAGIAGGWQNNGYEGDGQDGSRPVKQMVSRGVSTCNLLDLSWLLRSVEAASGLDLACQHILREKYAHCGRRLECVYHQMWFKNTKANLLRPQLMNGVCSPVKGRLPPSDLIQKGGCPLSCHPVPVCCCSLLKPLAIKGGHSLRRCLSISTPEQMLANSSAAEHIFDRRDHDASTDLSLLAGRFVPEPAAPPPTDTNPQPICPPPKYVEGRPQGDISALGDPPTLMIQHSRLSPLLPTAGLLFVSGGRSPDDLAVLRAMGTLSSSVTVQGLQADAPCPPLVFHTNVDPALTATCPSLIRSASSSQLPPLW